MTDAGGLRSVECEVTKLSTSGADRLCVLRILGSLDIREEMANLFRKCLIETTPRTIHTSDLFALPVHCANQRWVFVHKDEIMAKYPGLVRIRENAMVQTLQEDELAVPTLEFVEGELDRLTFGNTAVVVKKENFSTKSVCEPVSSFPKLQKRCVAFWEHFSPTHFVYQNGAVACLYDRGMSIRWLTWDDAENISSVVLSDCSAFTTHKPYISKRRVLYAGVSVGERFMVVSVNMDTCAVSYSEDYTSPVRSFYTGACGEILAVEEHAKFKMRNFMHPSGGGVLFLSNGSLWKKESRESKPSRLTTKKATYAACHGPLGISMLSLKKKKAEYTHVRYDTKKSNRTCGLNYVPLAMCISSDGALWLSGVAVSLVRYSDARMKSSQREFIEVNNCLESVVELMPGPGSTGSVIALTPKKIWLVHSDGSHHSFGAAMREYMYGLMLKDEISMPNECVIPACSTCSREAVATCPFHPICFYKGNRVPIGKTDSSVRRDEEGRITSVDLGNEHDVLVNANTAKFVAVQHLASYIVVENRGMRLRDVESDVFILSGHGDTLMSKSNDVFGCVRHPEIYASLSEKIIGTWGLS